MASATHKPRGAPSPHSAGSENLVEVTVELDGEVVKKFEAAGQDWRERIEAVLRAWRRN
jgi:uncharacterized protein (DUF4415 family)